MTRTIYMMASQDATAVEAKPRPVQIRTGISDGVYTEVTEGLKEGQTIITALNLPLTATTSQPQTVNPFGGGGRGFGPR